MKAAPGTKCLADGSWPYPFSLPGHSFHPAFILIFSESHLSPSLSSPGQGRRKEEPQEGGQPGLMRDERSGPGLRSGGRAGPGQEVGQARVAPAWRRGAASAERPGGTAQRGLGLEARRGSPSQEALAAPASVMCLACAWSLPASSAMRLALLPLPHPFY